MTTRSSTLEFETVRLGDQLPELRKRVTVEQIRAYAEASGDRNPIHLDDQFARSVGLPGQIAHGMLTMAFSNQCVTDWSGSRAALRRLSGRFAAMVLPGDEVRCSGEIATKDEKNRQVTVNLNVTNQRGERLMSKAVAEVQF